MAAPNIVRWDNARYFGAEAPDVKMLVWHATAGESAQSSAGWVNRPGVPPKEQASYHYIIERDGTIYRMCPLNKRAFHAGRSAWPVPASGVPVGSSVNRRSLGIAFANKNDGEPLTAAQIESGLWLGVTLMKRFSVPWNMNLAHREVAPGRKSDPLPAVLSMDSWREQLKDLWQSGTI